MREREQAIEHFRSLSPARFCTDRIRRHLRLRQPGMAGPIISALLLTGCDATPIAKTIPQIGCPFTATSSASWYSTVAPFEGGNGSERSHVFTRSCASVDEEHTAAVAAVADEVPGVYNVVTRGAGEVFALGGSYGSISQTNTPFVAGLDANTLALHWQTRLPGIGIDDWNYPGAVGVHANGDVYVVYGRNIARLHPKTGAVLAHTRLPVNQPSSDVAYNGFVVLSDGRIAAKSIHRKPGCREADFQAFFHCETAGVAASTLALVDPETLTVEQAVTLPEHTRFRLTATRVDATEFIYLPGEEKIHRYRYAQGRLIEDDGWRPAYLTQGQTAGTAVAGFGDWLIVQSNGMPASAPLAVVAISQRDADRTFRIEPFENSAGKGSFMPSMPTVDVENGRVYAFDGYAGQLAALAFDAGQGFSLAWKVEQRSFAFTALVGPADKRALVSTDLSGWLPNLLLRHLSLKSKAQLMRFNVPRRESIVWREAASGQEMGRTEALAAVGGSVLTPGFGAALLVPDLKGERLLRLAPVENQLNSGN